MIRLNGPGTTSCGQCGSLLFAGICLTCKTAATGRR
jgi:hypothetical protein